MLTLTLGSVPVKAMVNYSTADVQMEELQEQALGFYNIFVTCGRWMTEDGETLHRTVYISINGVRIGTMTQWEKDIESSWFTAPNSSKRLSVKGAMRHLSTQRRTTVTKAKSNASKLYFYITGTRAGDSVSVTFLKKGKVLSKVPRLEMMNGWQSITRPKKATTAIIRIYYKEGGSKKVTVSL